MTNISDINRRNGKTAWLNPVPALMYEAMKRDGMPGGCVSDAGRTNAEQWQMWSAYKAGKLKATAAYPGTSKHEKGNALDLAEPARSWVRSHGAKYGWVKDRVKNEPWHFEHDGTVYLPQQPNLEPTRPSDPLPDPEGEIDMVLMRTTDAPEGVGAIFLVQPNKPPRRLTPQEYGLWVRLGYTATGGDFLRVEVDIVANTLGG